MICTQDVTSFQLGQRAFVGRYYRVRRVRRDGDSGSRKELRRRVLRIYIGRFRRNS